MRNYLVYFEVFGKRMKTKVIAESITEARQKVLDKVVFHKIEDAGDEFNNIMDIMDDNLTYLDKLSKHKK